MFATLNDLEASQRVLVRVDLNSPVEDGIVQDNRRFSLHAKTLSELAGAGHRVAVLSHQGRHGQETFLPLEQHSAILTSHLGHDVGYVPDIIGEQARTAIRNLTAGDIVLLDNVRMLNEELANRTPEEHAKSTFVQTLAPEFDAYVGDAFSTAHRVHASIVGFPRVMDAYAGRVMEAEFTANSSIQSQSFDGLVTMVLGGMKVNDLIYVMERVETKVDTFLLGGIVGELFLRAAGHDVGFDVESTAYFDDQWEANSKTIKSLLETYDERIVLPVDLAYVGDEGKRVETPVRGVHKSTSFLDIGSETIESYAPIIEDSAAIFVKGALGVFEDERFGTGTVGVLTDIANTEAFSVIGGGDTTRVIDLYEISECDFSHISIAGGAYVRALTGEPLPGVDELSR